MTLANAKRLYKHYKDTGQDENAANILQRRPELANVPQSLNPTPETVPKKDATKRKRQ